MVLHIQSGVPALWGRRIGGITLNQQEFDQFFAILKPVVDSGRSDDFFKRHPVEEMDLTREQGVRLLKYLDAGKFASLCKKAYGFEMDYTPENLLYLDIVVSSLCALDLDDTQITRLLCRDANMPHDWDESAMQLLLTYTIKARYEELKDKLKSEAFGPRQLLACVNDQVLADLMEGINAYLCETFLNCYGGQWQCDAIRDGHADALGIRTKQGEYISFWDAVLHRFTEEDLPLCYVFCAVCHLDYSEMPHLLGEKYKEQPEA